MAIVNNKPPIITRRDFLKMTGAAAGTTALGAASVFNLAKVAELFVKHPEATGALKINIVGVAHYIPVYRGDE